MWDNITLQLQQLDNATLGAVAFFSGLIVIGMLYYNSKNPQSGNVPNIIVAVAGFICVFSIILFIT